MPKKQHHELLVFKKTVWFSWRFDMEQDSQYWRIYWRSTCPGAPWWVGLVHKGYVDMKNKDVPEPILRAYAFTEWTL